MDREEASLSGPRRLPPLARRGRADRRFRVCGSLHRLPRQRGDVCVFADDQGLKRRGDGPRGDADGARLTTCSAEGAARLMTLDEDVIRLLGEVRAERHPRRIDLSAHLQGPAPAVRTVGAQRPPRGQPQVGPPWVATDSRDELGRARAQPGYPPTQHPSRHLSLRHI